MGHFFEMIEKLNSAKVTLSDGSVITGTSWGIIDAQDDDGESLGYEVLVFDTKSAKSPLILKEEDILSVERL